MSDPSIYCSGRNCEVALPERYEGIVRDITAHPGRGRGYKILIVLFFSQISKTGNISSNTVPNKYFSKTGHNVSKSTD